MTSPTPIGKQSQNNAAPAATNSGGTASVEIPPAPAVAPPAPSSDITGALSGASRARIGAVQVPPSEKLPDGIAGPGLRTAAMKGDATAAYEIGVRFAEGKGVAANYDEAAKWYDRAAQAGVVPATFRLGTLYEKGLGVKKDADIARRYYTQAAERGNAKAMHNLAVLDADGGGRGANYKSAAQWFRKAADRGVADSQFNLGILYARGIGVEQNLAESYKWFTLAAAQGDADCGDQARRRRQAPRPAIARRRQARDPDLQRRAAARRRRQRPDPRRRLGRWLAGEHKARAEAGGDEEVGVGGALRRQIVTVSLTRHCERSAWQSTRPQLPSGDSLDVLGSALA